MKALVSVAASLSIICFDGSCTRETPVGQHSGVERCVPGNTFNMRKHQPEILIFGVGSRARTSSSSLISSLLHSRVNLEWCDNIKLSNLLLPRKSGTIKSLQVLSTSGTLLLEPRTRAASRHAQDRSTKYISSSSSSSLLLSSLELSDTQVYEP